MARVATGSPAPPHARPRPERGRDCSVGALATRALPRAGVRRSRTARPRRLTPGSTAGAHASGSCSPSSRVRSAVHAARTTARSGRTARAAGRRVRARSASYAATFSRRRRRARSDPRPSAATSRSASIRRPAKQRWASPSSSPECSTLTMPSSTALAAASRLPSANARSVRADASAAPTRPSRSGAARMRAVSRCSRPLARRRASTSNAPASRWPIATITGARADRGSRFDTPPFGGTSETVQQGTSRSRCEERVRFGSPRARSRAADASATGTASREATWRT